MKTVKFAVVGDYGTQSSVSNSVSTLIHNNNVDFILALGDNRYGSLTYDQAVGSKYYDFLKDINSGPNCKGGTAKVNSFFPTAGNHDYNEGGGIEEYLGYFKELPGKGIQSSNTSGSKLYYDFIMGNVHFFCIDSEQVSIPIQQAWLRTQLKNSKSTWKLVFTHKAPYSSSIIHGSSPSMQWPFAEWGADAVLAGHVHVYERINRDGILYFVNGLGGKSIYPFSLPFTKWFHSPVPGSKSRYNNNYGALFVESTSTTLTFKFLNIDGVLIDSAVLKKDTECLKADFKTRIVSGLKLKFIDESKGDPKKWKWDFGDGTSSRDQNPIHTYKQSGKYIIKLTVKNLSGKSSKRKTVKMFEI